jgi:type IV pilus assembly protein PilA
VKNIIKTQFQKEIMTMLKMTNKKGFTLIELIIVVAIMAVLVALLAPNVLKYLEKSKVGKDINSLDSVRLAVEAELMDDVLSTYSTGMDSSKIKGISLSALYGKTAGSNEKKLASRLFDALNGAPAVLDGSFKTNAVFASRAAQGAEIQIFIDGKGGIAVAAVKSGAIIKYDGEPLVVFTKIANASSTTIEGMLAPAK